MINWLFGFVCGVLFCCLVDADAELKKLLINKINYVIIFYRGVK